MNTLYKQYQSDNHEVQVDIHLSTTFLLYLVLYILKNLQSTIFFTSLMLYIPSTFLEPSLQSFLEVLLLPQISKKKKRHFYQF